MASCCHQRPVLSSPARQFIARRRLAWVGRREGLCSAKKIALAVMAVLGPCCAAARGERHFALAVRQTPATGQEVRMTTLACHQDAQAMKRELEAARQELATEKAQTSMQRRQLEKCGETQRGQQWGEEELFSRRREGDYNGAANNASNATARDGCLETCTVNATTNETKCVKQTCKNTTNGTVCEPCSSGRKQPVGQVVIGTLISIFQAVLFTFLGLANLFFGNGAEKLTTVVQAMLASGWDDLINSFMSVTTETIVSTLEKVVFFATGALTMAIATLKSATGRKVLKGTTTGYLIADPLLKILSGILFSNLAGCTELGEKTPDFPGGRPSNCSKPEMFDVCLNLTKALLWINVAIFGKLGLVFAEFFVILSAAMAGAGMLIKSLVGLLFAIFNASMPGGVPPEVKLGLDGVQTVLTYAFAGLGILVMIGMKPVFDALKVQEDGPKKGEKMLGAQPDLTKAMGPAKYIVGCGCFALVLKMADTIDSMVSQKLNPPTEEEKKEAQKRARKAEKKAKKKEPKKPAAAATPAGDAAAKPSRLPALPAIKLPSLPFGAKKVAPLPK